MGAKCRKPINTFKKERKRMRIEKKKRYPKSFRHPNFHLSLSQEIYQREINFVNQEIESCSRPSSSCLHLHTLFIPLVLDIRDCNGFFH